MSMFFLISGFVLYKEGAVWDTTQLKRFFKKKFRANIIPANFHYNMDKNGYDVLEGFINEPKYGYWFTYILFILIFMLCEFLFQW